MRDIKLVSNVWLSCYELIELRIAETSVLVSVICVLEKGQGRVADWLSLFIVHVPKFIKSDKPISISVISLK